MTFETFDQSDEETGPDQHFDNFWQFCHFLKNVLQFLQLLTIWQFLTNLEIVDNFWQFRKYWTILKILGYFDQFWYFFFKFWQFWHLWAIVDNWTIMDNLIVFDDFDNLSHNYDKFWQFWTILDNLDNFGQFWTILTRDICDNDYNSDNWEPDFVTIFVTWQLRVILDSIRNSCDVSYWTFQIVFYLKASQPLISCHYLPFIRYSHHCMCHSSDIPQK